MSESVFLDTCVLIGHSFPINSHHSRSKTVFNEYSKYYWSGLVKGEYLFRFSEKLMNIIVFLNDLDLDLEFDREYYTLSDLMKFASEKYSGDLRDELLSSVEPFWNKYFKSETWVDFKRLRDAINNCHQDLVQNSSSRERFLNNILTIVPKRTKDYHDLGLVIGSEGAGDNDVKIALDGHDFACKSVDPIGFVTFDDKLYRGSLKANLCFNSIKGEYDFN